MSKKHFVRISLKANFGTAPSENDVQKTLKCTATLVLPGLLGNSGQGCVLSAVKIHSLFSDVGLFGLAARCLSGRTSRLYPQLVATLPDPLQGLGNSEGVAQSIALLQRAHPVLFPGLGRVLCVMVRTES